MHRPAPWHPLPAAQCVPQQINRPERRCCELVPQPLPKALRYEPVARVVFNPTLTNPSCFCCRSLLPAAYYFTRSILLCIRTLEGKQKTQYDAEWKGWVLTGFFFLDAWLLGGFSVRWKPYLYLCECGRAGC